MFKTGEVRACELAGAEIPELAGKEFSVYGVSDPEAPESLSLIHIEGSIE